MTPCRDNVTVAVVDIVEDDDPRLPSESGTEVTGKAVTAPVPVVSKSVLHEPRVTDGRGDAEAGEAAPSKTGTLLLDEVDDVDETDPELFHDTAELQIVEHDVPQAVQPRSRLAMGLGALVLVAVLAVGGFFFARSYARSGYFIAEDAASGELNVFQGRRGGFLGFDPLLVSMTGQTLPADDQASQAMIEEEFSTLDEAEAVLERLSERNADVATTPAAEPDGTQGASESSDDPGDASDSNANLGDAEGSSESSTTTSAG
jgi:hypothetical protein